MSQEKSSCSLRKALFIVLSAALFVESLEYGLITPLVPYYTSVLGLSPSEMGLIFAVYSLALLLVSFLAGKLCYFFGFRQITLAGLVILFVSTICFAFAGNKLLLVISRFIQGAAGASIWTASLAEAAVIIPSHERGSKLGIMMSLTGLGTIAGPFFSGIVFEYFGYKAPFLGTALIIIPIAVLLFMMPVQEKVIKLGIAPSINYNYPVLNRKVLLALSLSVVVSFSFGLLEPLLPLHLSREFNLDSKGIGLFFGVYSMIFSVIQPVWGSILDRFGYRPLILSGLIASAILSPFISLTKHLLTLYVVGVFFSMATCAVITPCLPLLAKYSEGGGREAYGKNFGLVNVAWSVGLLLGPPVGGFIYENLSFLWATGMYSIILLGLGVSVVNGKKRFSF